ncbi:MAG: cell division protein FtsQ/DivIB [Pseudomonadota bacterium]
MKAFIWVLTGMLGFAAILLAIWMFGGMNKAAQWPIRWLEVAGELDRTTAEQVRAAVAAEASNGFFAVNTDHARDAVIRLPWVASASIRKRWPDALEIDVIEHRVIARWNQTGLLSTTGEVFDVAGTAGMQGLTHLYGPELRREDVFETWQQLRRQLAAAGLEIRLLELDPRGAWSLELDSGQQLLLGREQVEQRLQRFLAVHRQLAGMQDVARIDLRYPNGLSVTRRSAQAENQASQLEADDSPELGAIQITLPTESGAQSQHG